MICGQRYVVAELSQELALGATECMRGAPRHHQYAEHAATLFDHERDDHHRTQSASRETLRKRKLHVNDVGLVHQLAGDAAREPILVDLDVRLLGHRELE